MNAKRKILPEYQPGTTSILNADDNAVVELARDPMVQRGPHLLTSRANPRSSPDHEHRGSVAIKAQVRVRTGPEIEYYSVENTKMKGKHAYENIMAAILAAREHGAKHEAIQRVIDN